MVIITILCYCGMASWYIMFVWDGILVYYVRVGRHPDTLCHCGMAFWDFMLVWDGIQALLC